MKRRWPTNYDDFERKPKRRFPVPLAVLIAAILILVAVILVDPVNPQLVLPAEHQSTPSTHTSIITTIPATLTETPTLSSSPTPKENPSDHSLYPDGLWVLSLADGYYTHLFAYHPADLQLTRLTNHPWDDMHPSISPDGTRLAYTSRRNGFWDIYVLDLVSGSATRVTDSLAYDGRPTWSPDGLWLAYESYQTGNLEIFLQSLANLSSSPLQLTDDPSPDYDPAWSPTGIEIAFTSLCSGEPEIWTAAVNQVENRLQNRSLDPDHADTSPAWSPDGTRLTWSRLNEGSPQIMLLPVAQPGSFSRPIGSGKDPLWSPDGTRIVFRIDMPNSTYLAGYTSDNHRLVLPPLSFGSEPYGITWSAGDFGHLLSAYLLPETGGLVSLVTRDPANIVIDPATGRTVLVSLEGVSAPQALLSDRVDESFNALRREIARLSGWDVLANLENAYRPITGPSNPGDGEDWLTTGLAFAINPLPLQAGWMVVQREDFSGEVFWRLYIRARYQDGSQGEPIRGPVWDLEARAGGDLQAYEEGGAYKPPPSGYWIDLTALASRFGWQRLPALPEWRTYYSGTRFNQFAWTRNMDWENAMLELYPPELIHPPTHIPSLTSTPTATSAPMNSRTATAQAASWLLHPTSPNPRPTWTPQPGETYP